MAQFGGMEPDNAQPSPQPGYGPLGGPVANPDSLIELSIYKPSPFRSARLMVEQGIADGVLPLNIRGELENPVVERAALLYLAKHDDVVAQREFEDRFTSFVIEAARSYRSEQEGADGAESNPTLGLVRRILNLLDGGVLSAQEAEEALTWPTHSAEIERRAASRLLEPPPSDDR